MMRRSRTERSTVIAVQVHSELCNYQEYISGCLACSRFTFSSDSLICSTLQGGSRREKYLRKENISQIAFTSSPSLSRLETCLAVNHHMVGEPLTESLQQGAEPSLSTHFCCCPLQHYTVMFNTSNMVLCKGFKELFIPFLERFIKVWPSV